MQTALTGSRSISRKNANVVWSEFEKVRQQRGKLTAKTVVEAAKSVRSPLHSFFEWDDRVAGYAHRLAQASELIRSVHITIRADPNDKPRNIRGLVSVVTNGGREYVPAVEALSLEDYRQQMLTDALRELEAFKQKYRRLSQLVVVFAAITEVQRKVRRKKSA